MKKLLITHCDLDGISPIILMNLTGEKFDYKSIEINEIDEIFDELFLTDLNSIYDEIYITDLTLNERIYNIIKERKLNVFVFDHHATHLFAENYKNVTIKVEIDGVKTCGTELFYLYLKDKYESLNKSIVSDYVKQVRELDTYCFTSELPKQIELFRSLYGKNNFVKTITNRLKKDKKNLELTAFEKRYVKLETEHMTRYMQIIEKKFDVYKIQNKICGVVFAEKYKSELGNYLAEKYPKLDLIIIIDASKAISYRTCKDDVDVAKLAEAFGGGGHKKASGSRFDSDSRNLIINNYFKESTKLNKDEYIN